MCHHLINVLSKDAMSHYSLSLREARCPCALEGCRPEVGAAVEGEGAGERGCLGLARTGPT